jgi:hypothetical protein
MLHSPGPIPGARDQQGDAPASWRRPLDALEPLGELPGRASVHLDRAYPSATTRCKLAARCLIGVISQKGKSAPLGAGLRWVVERTNSWHNAHKKLL